MNYDNVKDYRLQKVLKNAIRSKCSPADRVALKTFLNCGTKSVNNYGVAILSNSHYSRLSGARMCHNAWACPVCSAFVMARYATRIAAAIDALKKEYVPIMITYTIFHSKNDSCQQAFDLLFGTWKRYQGGCRSGGVYSNFLRDCEIKHYVRCAEVTFTENGWHPHLHVLYFVPKSKLHIAAAKEMALREAWKSFEMKEMERISSYTKYDAFKISKELHGETAAGVYLSKDEKGNPVIMKSSDYVCGWGADKELTGNYLKEATCKTSRTPHQLIMQASDGDQMAIQLYLEFAKYVVKHKRRRVDFSRTGLNAIITNYMNSEGYKEVIKKKRTQLQEEGAAWQTVIWFSNDDWYEICQNDLPLVFMMLCFAKYQNGFELIAELLAINNVRVTPLKQDPIGYHQQLAKELSAA